MLCLTRTRGAPRSEITAPRGLLHCHAGSKGSSVLSAASALGVTAMLWMLWTVAPCSVHSHAAQAALAQAPLLLFDGKGELAAPSRSPQSGTPRLLRTHATAQDTGVQGTLLQVPL